MVAVVAPQARCDSSKVSNAGGVLTTSCPSFSNAPGGRHRGLGHYLGSGRLLNTGRSWGFPLLSSV